MSGRTEIESGRRAVLKDGSAVLLRQLPVEQIVDLRHRVLRAGLPREAAMFEKDHAAGTLHFGAIAHTDGKAAAGETVVSCATFHPDQWESAPAWRLRGMATESAYRGRGVGRALLGFAETVLVRASPAATVLWCNARVPAVRFYESLGWTVMSPEFDVPTAGPHHVMVKRLDVRRSGAAELTAPSSRDDSPTPPFFEVRASPTGRGVFATEPIAAGWLLIRYTGPLLRYEQTTPDTLALQIGPDLYLGESGGPDDFVNHSCDPNAGIVIDGSDVRLIALRDISPGEQIAFDYSTTMDEDDFEFDCRCGSQICRGRIRDFKHLPIQLRRRYVERGVVPGYNRKYVEG